MRLTALPGQDFNQAAVFLRPLAKEMPAALHASFTPLLDPLPQTKAVSAVSHFGSHTFSRLQM